MKNIHVKCVALLSVAIIGCSFVLDVDSTQEGSKNTNVDTHESCISDSDCDDGINCTDDICSVDKVCAYLPVNSRCDHLEICDLLKGCVSSGDDCWVDEDCDDKVDCTDDVCVLKECVNTPNHIYCDDEDPCIVDEVCDTVNGCLEGSEMDCGLSEEICSFMKCNPESGECEDYLMNTADNDNDTYLDIFCGGDDCDDENANVYPGAAELCDGIDNNCDHAIDLTILVERTSIVAETSIASPSVAVNADNYVVTWQRNEVSEAAAYVRFMAKNGATKGDIYNFTSLGGEGSSGFAPSVAAGSNAFYVAWVSESSTAEKTALLTPMSFNRISDRVEAGDLIVLSTDLVNALTPVQIAWDDNVTNGAWIAAWSAEQDDGTSTVRIQTPDMGDASFTVVSDTKDIGKVSISPLGEQDYVIAYSAIDDVLSNDVEVFESRVQLSGSSLWENMSGYPRMISSGNENEIDPSTNPRVTADGSGGWTVIYNDAANNISALDDDLLAWNGSSNSTLLDGKGSFLEDSAWSWSGLEFGLLYVKHADAGGGSYVEMLNFVTYDAALEMPPEPYVGTMLIESPMTLPEQDVSGTDIVGDSVGGFAAVWIETADSQDNLFFSAFQACRAE